eukprot:7672829-Pyramimonas_sp.AAC.1
MGRVTKSEGKLLKPTGLAQRPPASQPFRGRACHATQENARMVNDPFDQDDQPGFIPQEAYNAFIPLVLPNDATGAAEEAEANMLRQGQTPAMLGSCECCRKCGHRACSDVEFVVERAVCVARHCAECARSSGGWV